MDQSLVWWLVWTGIAMVVAQFVLHRWFERTSNPLKRLPPGPKPKPVIGNLGDLGALSHQTFAKWSSVYGPLVQVRMGSAPLIVANSSDLAKEILKTKDKLFSSRPNMTVTREMSYSQQTIGTAPMGPSWRTMRKIFVGELLSPLRTREFQDVRRDEGIALLKVLLEDSQGVRPAQIGIRLKDHIGNVVTSIMMKKRFFGPHADDPLDSTKFQSMLKGILDLASVFVLGDFIPLFKHWDIQGYKKKMREAHIKLDRFLQAQINERRQQIEQGAYKQNQTQTPFLDVLLTRSGENDEYPMTDTQFKGIFQGTFLAGIETTASVVEWTLAELIKNPEKMRKAQEELDNVVGRERIVDDSDINNLPYINAAINESLRLHPAAPLLIPRVAIEDTKIAGFDIPAKATVCVNVWALGRDPKLWEKPSEFSPERFLGSPIDASGHYYQFLPFGSGRRQCPGQSYGLAMVRTYVAILLQGCLFKPLPDQTFESLDMTEKSGLVLRRALPLEAILAPRLPNSVINILNRD